MSKTSAPNPTGLVKRGTFRPNRGNNPPKTPSKPAPLQKKNNMNEINYYVTVNLLALYYYR